MTGPPDQAMCNTDQENFPMGRNLEQIPTPEVLHQPMTSWPEKENKKWERESEREADQARVCCRVSNKAFTIQNNIGFLSLIQ